MRVQFPPPQPNRRPGHPCGWPGCPAITCARFCPQHQQRHARQKNAEQPSAYRRGYNRRWQRARLTFLAGHPLCAACAAVGRVTAANEVDHIVPHRGDLALFWDESNWQALCKPCHSRKTMKELTADP